MIFEPGQIAYLIENGNKVASVTVLKFDGVFCTVTCGGDGGFQIRATRLFPSNEEAENALKVLKLKRA